LISRLAAALCPLLLPGAALADPNDYVFVPAVEYGERERRAGAPGAKRQGGASNRESTQAADSSARRFKKAVRRPRRDRSRRRRYALPDVPRASGGLPAK